MKVFPKGAAIILVHGAWADGSCWRNVILTNGNVTGDKVGPHGDLLDEFPCLGPPHDESK